MPDSNSPLSPPRVALVGFGEAGEAFVRAPGWRGETRAWDLLPERRAAEMEESTRTLESLGVEPLMTRGTVQRQRAAAKAKRKDQAA